MINRFALSFLCIELDRDEMYGVTLVYILLLGHWSCIDHFIVSDNVSNEILDNRVVDSNDNLSNHLPVELSFSVNVNTRKDSGNRQGPNNDRCSSIQWNKANEDDISNYKRVLDNILSKSITYEAMYCESVCCNDNGHLADIEQMCKYVIDACLTAGDTGIPNVSGRKSTAGR